MDDAARSPTTAAAVCPACGGAGCEACERSWRSALVHRELVALALLIALAVAAFFFTRWAAQANQHLRQRDAAMWYGRGSADLQAGRVPGAVVSLRAAVALDRQNQPYRLALAGALTADHDDDAASQILIALRSLNPESAPINLQLARLEARRGDTEAALSYYQNALYGRWDRDQPTALREVRLELIDYLMQIGAQSRALSELLILSGNIRDTAEDHRAIGERFLQAGEPRRALDHFARALALGPSDPTAALAGQAAFDLGDYTAAERYFASVPATAATAAARDVTAAILANDPLAQRLPQAERRSRTVQLLTLAKARLDGCTIPDGALLRAAAGDAAAAMQKRSTGVSDLAEEGVRIAAQIETAVLAPCGAGAADDRAVILIARRHGLNQP